MAQGFDNQIKTLWLDSENYGEPGRDMQLLEDVNYTDSKGRIWYAPAWSIVNGASIPKVFWSIIGSPFVGKYRRATVIHDIFCDNHLRSSDDTHWVFNDIMKFDGVSDRKASIMYKAVVDHGPRW